MCGIAGIILKQKASFNLVNTIVAMSKAIKHRGPDGEGFIVAGENGIKPCYGHESGNFTNHWLNYSPKNKIDQIQENSFLAFAHRRLSIIDLSETGHQPMCTQDGKKWISYNGEIYNYIELRKTLTDLGRKFISESDTEVILQAYEEWGTSCIDKFNGMWAFCIYDSEKRICFASRDRLGVKPFYYLNTPQLFCFASEQKAFIKSGLLQADVNNNKLSDYLINGSLERENSNFFENVNELWPAHNLIYNVWDGSVKLFPYFNLNEQINSSNDSLSENELIEKINETLTNAIKLRLRSDVAVGSCLSGGIDSSAIVTTLAELQQKPLSCFTSVFKGELVNEEKYADAVADRIKAIHYKVEPTFEGFINELDELVYSQDVPIWDPSTYAQHKVMELAKLNGIKVVLDGQGADELFGGYHHHFVAKWNYLIKQNRYTEFLSEINASVKSIPSPWSFYAKERIKSTHNFNRNKVSGLLKEEFIATSENKPTITYFNELNQQLLHDINEIRLKIFLKCEDRCGMWHGVESRTPFSDDIELLKLAFSFNGNKKIKNGISKYLLREAVKAKLPATIYNRYDKKGFETPTVKWIEKLRPQLISEIQGASFNFLNQNSLANFNSKNNAHNKLLFKLFVFARWKRVFQS